MPEEKSRLARLSAILTQLQSKNIVTARTLADRHQVSIRTIYRDIRTLEQSGVPIVTEEGRGYSIVDGYTLPPIMFSEEEAMALITAERIIEQNNDLSLVQKYADAITKIKSVLKRSQKEKTELVASRLQVRSYEEDNTSPYLIQLQSYIADYRVVHIDYISLSDNHTQRAIEPFALYTTRGNWILIAFCHKADEFRAFRLDRIEAMRETSEKFEPHKMTLEEYLEECRKKWSDTPDTPLS